MEIHSESSENEQSINQRENILIDRLYTDYKQTFRNAFIVQRSCINSTNSIGIYFR